MHVNCEPADTEPHLNPAAGVIGITNGYRARLRKLRRITLHHLRVHDETTGAQNDPFFRAIETLFHVLPHHQPHDTLTRPMPIHNEAQRSGLQMHVDVARVHCIREDLDE